MKPAPLLRSVGLAAVSLLLAAGCGPKSNPGTSLCAVNDDLLSDFKTDNGIFPTDGGADEWFTYGDRSGFGTLDPLEGGAAPPTSTRATRTAPAPARCT